MKITDKPVIVFLSAVVAAFGAGVIAYGFIEGKIKEEVKDRLQSMKINDELPKGDPGDKGERGIPGKDGKDGDPGPIEIAVGTIMSFYGIKAPKGYLLCDGTTFTKSDYPKLYKHIANVNAALILSSEEAKTPDLQGFFLRGLDPSNKRDPEGSSRIIGHEQMDQFQTHNHKHDHPLPLGPTTHEPNKRGAGAGTWQEGSYGKVVDHDAAPTSGRYGAETRSDNVAVNFIIRHGH